MATTKPGAASIDWMVTKYGFVTVPDDLAYKNVVVKDEVVVPVKWSKWSGAGASKVEYLLNGIVYATQDLVATDGAQTGSIDLKFKKGGRFKLQVNLVNDQGSTISSNSQDLIIADTEGNHLDPLAMNINASRFPCKMRNKQFQQKSGKVVGAYAVEWSVYRVQGMDYYINNIPGDNITHLFYGFLGIVGKNDSFKTENPQGYTTMARIVPGLADFEVFPPDPWAAYQKPIGTQVNADAVKGCYGELMAFGKRYPHVKKIVSIGGWSLSDPFFFMDNAPNAIETFVNSVEKYLRTWKFWDGIDLDWEFPGVGGANTGVAEGVKDSALYVTLVQKLRTMLTRLGAEVGKTYEMTIAINAGYDKLAPMNYGEIAKSLDYINIMSYDFHGAWDHKKLSHHTNVFAPDFRPNDNTTQKYNCRREIDDLVAQGVPKAKLVLGAATYGRGWAGVPAAAGTDVFLGQAKEKSYAGPQNDTQKYWLGLGSIMYAQIAEEMTTANGWEYRYDAKAEAPFVFKAATGELITFDDPRSVAKKCQIVMAEGLGGVFNWEMDTDNGDILNAMNEGVGNPLAGTTPVDGVPTANAGPDQSVAIATVVTLNGSGSTDPEAKPLTYAWKQVSGPAVTLTNANAVQASFTAPSVSADTVFSFELAVTDAAGQVAKDTVIVTVKAAVTPVDPKPLTVTTTANTTVDANAKVTLSATSDNPNNGTLSYVWKQTKGTPVVLVAAGANGVQFTSPTLAAGDNLEFQVTVSDGKAVPVVKLVSIGVRSNRAPTASAGTNGVAESGATVTLTGVASDADGNALTYAWTQSNGPAVTLSAPKALVTTFAAPAVTADTALVFKLSVSDGVATAVVSEVTITVKPKSTGGSTYPAYVAGKQYSAGDKVNYGGYDWQANYWTQNVAPARGVGDWKLLFTGTLPWDANIAYNANDLCTFNGFTWKASFWTKGDKPGLAPVWVKQ